MFITSLHLSYSSVSSPLLPISPLGAQSSFPLLWRRHFMIFWKNHHLPLSHCVSHPQTEYLHSTDCIVPSCCSCPLWAPYLTGLRSLATAVPPQCTINFVHYLFSDPWPCFLSLCHHLSGRFPWQCLQQPCGSQAPTFLGGRNSILGNFSELHNKELFLCLWSTDCLRSI